MSIATEVEVKLLPHQYRVVTSRSPTLVLSGAWGSGKTYPLAVKAMLHARYPGNLCALFRKRLHDLRETTLRALLRGDGGLPPALPPDTYEHNRADRTIRISGGGTIYYTGLDRETRLGSLNLGWAGVDEAIEITRDDFTAIRGRLRNTAGPYRQAVLVTNPGPRGHWLYADLLAGARERKHDGAHTLRKDLILDNGRVLPDAIEVILSSTADNPFLPADYTETLRTLSEQARRRYYGGEWVTFEGLVYDRFDREVHVGGRPEGKALRTVIGVDVGYTNPSVLLPIEALPDGALYVPEEMYQAGLTEEELVAEALQLSRRYPSATFCVDPSAAALIGAFGRARLPVVPADNAVFPGIQRVQGRLLPLTQGGRPGLRVSDGCTELIREFESYAWRRGKVGLKDEPLKQFDHALDALRYAVGRLQEETLGGTGGAWSC